jgi:alkanesulfonate monooxygenase SsuD/methylene tetrahydromethanopterin reductase-like flavin-dependent oxidoreductase (luciferase family)
MRLSVALHGGTTTSGTDLVADAVATARTARDAGYSGVVAGQHFLTAPQAYLQPLPLLTRLIPETGGMRLVAGVLLLPLLNPIQLAEELATIDTLSGGRLVVGAGQGYRQVEFDAFGVDRRRRRDLQIRALEELVSWWRAEEVRGTGSRLGLLPLQQPHPPIWLAAGTRTAFGRARERGWVPFIGPQATDLDELLDASGSPVALRRDVLVVDVVGEAAAREAATQRSQQYGQWGYQSATATSPYVVGSADECRRQLSELGSAGVTDVVVRTNWPGIDPAASREMLAALAPTDNVAQDRTEQTDGVPS